MHKRDGLKECLCVFCRCLHRPWVSSYFRKFPMHIYCLPVQAVNHKARRRGLKNRRWSKNVNILTFVLLLLLQVLSSPTVLKVTSSSSSSSAAQEEETCQWFVSVFLSSCDWLQSKPLDWLWCCWVLTNRRWLLQLICLVPRTHQLASDWTLWFWMFRCCFAKSFSRMNCILWNWIE